MSEDQLLNEIFAENVTENGAVFDAGILTVFAHDGTVEKTVSFED